MSEKLTPKQQRFVEEYLIDLNATQAAIRAGYSKKTAGSIGEENLKKPEIASAIQKAKAERSNRTQITQDEVLKDLCELRDICMGRKKIIVTDVIKDVREGTAKTVKAEAIFFEPTAANRSLELLGKHLKMFADKVELSGNVDIVNRIIEARKAVEKS